MSMSEILALLREHLDVVIAIGSALVALVSAFAARTETRRQRRLQTERLRQSIDAASLEWGNHAIDPNLNPDNKGADKDGAYRGHRPPILDAIMWAYCELDAMHREGGPTGDNSAEFIEDCRRLMVSELQAHLDPRRLDKVVERYDDQTQANRRDAIDRANALKARLETRRPGLALDATRAPDTQSETMQ